MCGCRSSASFDFDAPFELRALEVALATVTNVLDSEVFELERDAYPTMGKHAGLEWGVGGGCFSGGRAAPVGPPPPPPPPPRRPLQTGWPAT